MAGVQVIPFSKYTVKLAEGYPKYTRGNDFNRIAVVGRNSNSKILRHY
jgi:hypothetical protein